MKVAVFGCLHGQLDDMFRAVEQHETEKGYKIQLIIVCGDCQTIRHLDDLRCLAVPSKYKRLGDFHDYYAGKKKVPRLTIFVGGNHEASNYLMTLPYGGWVCENFYYLGFSSVINYRGLRIGGISGIYNYHSSNRGRFERMPLDEQSMRSIYHTRKVDVFRLQLLSKNIDNKMLDVFISHDWPARIYDHGNLVQLLKFKPFFKDDMQTRDGLGNPLTQPLVRQLKPRRWFAAHLHCRFYAKVVHTLPKDHFTEFLSLNKIEGKRQYDEYLDLSPINDEPVYPRITHESAKEGPGPDDEDQLYYDPEWLTILRKTIDLETNAKSNVPCPNLNDQSGESYFPTEEEIQETIDMMARTGGLMIPKNFCMADPVVYGRIDGQPASIDKFRTKYYPNPQHLELCSRLNIPDKMAVCLVDDPKEHNDNGSERSHFNHQNRHSSHHPSTNPAYPHRNYQHTGTPRPRGRSQNEQPAKKQAFDLDEDGCLPFVVDKTGDA